NITHTAINTDGRNKTVHTTNTNNQDAEMECIAHIPEVVQPQSHLIIHTDSQTTQRLVKNILENPSQVIPTRKFPEVTKRIQTQLNLRITAGASTKIKHIYSHVVDTTTKTLNIKTHEKINLMIEKYGVRTKEMLLKNQAADQLAEETKTS